MLRISPSADNVLAHLASVGVKSDRLPVSVRRMSMRDYHESGAESRSLLLAMHNGTPKHYLAQRNQEYKETDAMIVGSAAHAKLFEPDVFAAEYVVSPFPDRRKKDYKDWAAEIPPDIRILSAQQGTDVDRMCESVLSDPDASAMLRNGRAEVSYFWEDPQTGLACRCRADYERMDTMTVFDLKTSADISDKWFYRHAYNMGYHVQAAYYAEGVMRTHGLQRKPDFLIVAVESSPPYLCRVFNFSEDALAAGEMVVRGALHRIAECWKRDSWPGYPEGISTLELPAYAD